MTPFTRVVVTIALLLVAATLAATPATRMRIARALAAVRNPTVRARRWTTLTVCVVAIAYMLVTALYQQRELIPKFHDEHMHLLQMQMLARGKLWMAQHLLADFFETFHVMVKPVYASIYFPGTALMYVPTVWLHLPFWLMPLLIAGLGAGLMYRVTAELIDGVAGLLAALMLVSLQWFRYLSLMVMSHSVMLLLGLAIVWAWLHWRRERSLKWTTIIGALMGWAAITRPVDALCYSIPVGAAMLICLWREKPARIAATLVILCVAAAPFLALQVIQNVGITGDPLKSPYRLYADLYTPQMSFGFHRFDETIRPQTTLPQRQDYYDEFTIPAARKHRPQTIVQTWLKERFPMLADVTTPNRILLVLLPLSLFAFPWRGRPARAQSDSARTGRTSNVGALVLWSVLPLWIAFYAVFAYVLPVYCVVVAPAVIFAVLLGKTFAERSGEAVEVFLTTSIVMLYIAALPEIDHQVIDDGFPAPSMSFSYSKLREMINDDHAIVLFRYRKGDNVNEEPVYNIDVAWPDDAPIIRAHDLGVQRDRELFDYYAEHQPRRNVFLYDRASRTLAPLGNVTELARRFPVKPRM